MSSVTVKNRASRVQTLTISSGGTQSSVADARKVEFAGFIAASAFSSTEVTFQVGPSSSSDATFYPLYAGGAQVSVVVSTSEARAYGLSDDDARALQPWPWLRLVSGSTGEEAARTLSLCVK